MFTTCFKLHEYFEHHQEYIDPASLTSLTDTQDLLTGSRQSRRARQTFSPEGREEFHTERQKHKEPRSPTPTPRPVTFVIPAREPVGDKARTRKRKRSLSPLPAHTGISSGGSEDGYKGTIVYNKTTYEAKSFALEISLLPARTDTLCRHILWTDGSIVLRCAAGAVAWQQPPDYAEWVSKGYNLSFSTSNTEVVEMFAIARALEIAVNLIQNFQEAASKAFNEGREDVQIQPSHQVFVFTDSIGALQRIEQCSAGFYKKIACQDQYREQVRTIGRHYKELRRLGARVELHLVPGHSSVPGNTMAHKQANNTARAMAHGTLPEYACQAFRRIGSKLRKELRKTRSSRPASVQSGSAVPPVPRVSRVPPIPCVLPAPVVTLSAISAPVIDLTMDSD